MSENKDKNEKASDGEEEEIEEEENEEEEEKELPNDQEMQDPEQAKEETSKKEQSNQENSSVKPENKEKTIKQETKNKEENNSIRKDIKEPTTRKDNKEKTLRNDTKENTIKQQNQNQIKSTKNKPKMETISAISNTPKKYQINTSKTTTRSLLFSKSLSDKKNHPSFNLLKSTDFTPKSPFKNYKNIKGCINCLKSKPKNPLTYSCNHLTCFECLVKDITISQFKNCENKNQSLFRCPCNIGNIIMSYEELISKLKIINKPTPPRKCREHSETGKKYCRDCELWLCEKCLEIHKVFNDIHILEEKEIPLKEICDEHSELTLYYCMTCKCEICSFCISNGGKHKDHKYIPLDKFKELTAEIRQKLKFKNLDECVKNLENIRDKKNKEKKNKIDCFISKIDELLTSIKQTKDNYLKQIEEKMISFNKVIDVIKECYKYFYNLLDNEKQNYYTLNYLNKIVEIIGVQTVYTNFDDIIQATNFIDNFTNKKTHFLYRIETNAMPSPYIIDTTAFDKLKKSALSKYSKNNYKEIKYEKSIKVLLNAIYAITKINEKSIAVASGKDILIIDDINSPEQDTLSGHNKNITCLELLSKNKLISGSEDKTIKIWDIKKSDCICTITGNYEKIDSISVLNENTIAVGAFNTIRIFNTENKKELYSLVGHEKSICSLIKINENLLISGSYDNLIKIWDLKEKMCSFTLYGHNAAVYTIILLNDGKLASGSGSWDKSLKIWNLENRKCEFTLIGHKREIRTLKQMSNGWLLSGSVDKTIKVWNLNKRCCIQTLVSHYDVIFSICVIDKEKFVSGGRDQEIIVWKY